MKSPVTGRTFTAAEERLITEDGFPPFLILSVEERHAAWERNPPHAVKSFTDPRIEQDRAMREEEKKIKATQRIQKMKAGLQKKSQTPLSTKGLRWDMRHCKWVPDGSGAITQEEDVMPKFVVTPYDAAGLPVKRAVTSIKDDASDEAIVAQCVNAAKRGGSKVATVQVTAADGSVVKIHTVVREQTAAQDQPTQEEASAATASSEANTDPTDAEQESDMAGKKKSKAKVKKVKGEVRKGSKTEIVAKLLKRETGCTAKQVLEATGWPAVSMPAISKACGLKLRKEKEKGSPTRYFGS